MHYSRETMFESPDNRFESWKKKKKISHFLKSFYRYPCLRVSLSSLQAPLSPVKTFLMVPSNGSAGVFLRRFGPLFQAREK